MNLFVNILFNQVKIHFYNIIIEEFDNSFIIRQKDVRFNDIYINDLDNDNVKTILKIIIIHDYYNLKIAYVIRILISTLKKYEKDCNIYNIINLSFYDDYNNNFKKFITAVYEILIYNLL